MKGFIVYDWMISFCKLNGNELILFASIYDDCIENTGIGIDMITYRLGPLMSRATIYRVLDSLEMKHLIYKYTSNSRVYYHYSSWILRALWKAEGVLQEEIRIAKTSWFKK